MSPPILSVQNLNSYYEKSKVLHDVSFQVHGGEALLILGLNGMGKTTLLRTIMSLKPPSGFGSIVFRDHEIIDKQPYDIADLGIGYVPQGRRVFPSLSVMEHLTLFFKKRSASNNGIWTPERIFEVFPILYERRKIRGSLLSGGEQQMLVIARALVTNPTLLAMDEPTEGLSVTVISQILDICMEIMKSGVSILLTEQNFEMATTLANRALILETGTIVKEVKKEECTDLPAFKEELGRYLRHLSNGKGT
jgi:branched-chain amino acid transport system ATP-binding protein